MKPQTCGNCEHAKNYTVHKIIVVCEVPFDNYSSKSLRGVKNNCQFSPSKFKSREGK